MPGKTGIWNQEEANKGHLFSYRLAQFIHKLIDDKPNWIYDFGCGKATYVKYLEDMGNKALGIEGEELEDFETGAYMVKDLSQPLSCMEEDEGHVISIEVGEHIPKEYEGTFITNISNHVKQGGYLVLSWAHEGQQGDGHVNCKPAWWIIQEFNKVGFELDIAESDRARACVENHVAYLKENLFVFRKK